LLSERERIGNLTIDTSMMRAKLALGALALGLTGLLAACGPGNTLAVGKGSEDFRLKTVEANLQKVQDDIKTLASHQQQNDGRLVEVHKKLAELVSTLEAQGVKMPAGASKGSALGVGFAHPEAAAAPAAPAEAAQNQGERREPGAAQQAAAQSPPTPGMAASAAPSGHTAGPPPGMPGGLPPAPMPHGAARLAQPPAAEPRNRQAMGRVGPAAGSVPATPEAAIAADRNEAVPAASAKAAAAPVPPAPPTPAAAPTPPATATAAPVPGAKTDEAPAAAKPVSPVSGNAETATPSQKAEYNKALQLAINGRNAEAKAAFDQFLVSNPDSPLTPNALYWVGEGAFARGEYQTAIADFEKVAKGWPGHHKAADSLYKMAMAQEKAGDVAAARAALERYLKDYPNAELAGIARQKLQALPK